MARGRDAPTVAEHKRGNSASLASETQARACPQELPNIVYEHRDEVSMVESRSRGNTAKGHVTERGRWMYAVRKHKSRNRLYACSCFSGRYLVSCVPWRRNPMSKLFLPNLRCLRHLAFNPAIQIFATLERNDQGVTRLRSWMPGGMP